MSRDTREVVKDVMERLRNSTSSSPHRLFLKVLDNAVMTQLSSPDGTVGYLNPYEANFRAVEADTSLARELVYILGYEILPAELQDGFELAMLDFANSRPALAAFHEFAMEELTRISPPNIESLKDIDNVGLLVAHLGYHYHLRFEHFALATPTRMASILEEDVCSSIDCIGYLCNKLGILQPGGLCHSNWETLRESAVESMVAVEPPFRRNLEELFMETARKMASELAGRVVWPVAQVYVYLFATQLIATLCYNGVQPVAENAVRYMDSADIIVSVCSTDKYMASVDKSRQLLMKTLDGQLSANEMSELTTATIWQTRNFIYHFQPDTLPAQAMLDGGTSSLMSSLLGTGPGRIIASHEEQTVSESTRIHVATRQSADANELSHSLRETLMALKEVVAPYPYRLFLKIMNRVAINDISYPDGTTDSLNSREMNICAVLVETELTRQLFQRMGYCCGVRANGAVYDIVMVDIAQHRTALAAFHDLAEEELRATVCPGIDDLAVIGEMRKQDSVPCLIVHLAYNLHLRVFLLTFTTPTKSLDMLEEDIYTGMDCVEYLALCLDIIPPGSDCRAAWYSAKQLIKKYVSSRGRDQRSVFSSLNDLYSDVSRQMDFELTLRVSRPLVAVFSYAYSVQQASQVSIAGEMLNTEMLFGYLDSFDDMASNCMSVRWIDSVERIRHLLLKSFDEPLPREEVLRVAEIIVWQSRNLVYQFQHHAIDEVDSVGQLLGITRRTVHRREDGTFVADVMEWTSAREMQSRDEMTAFIVGRGQDEEAGEIEKTDTEKEVFELHEESVYHGMHGAGMRQGHQTKVGVETQSHLLMQEHANPPIPIPAGLDYPESDSSGLYHASLQRLDALQEELDQLEGALKCDIEDVAAIALRQAVKEKKCELDLVQKFNSDLKMMQGEMRAKASFLGLLTLPETCVARMLKDILQIAHQPVSRCSFVTLLSQVVHLIPVAGLGELCNRLGVIPCSEASDTLEMIRWRLSEIKVSE